MNLEFTEEQQMIKKMARDFAEKRLKPVAAEIDEEHKFPSDIVGEMIDLGFLGVTYPAEYGGAEMDTLCYALAVEEISRGCASCGVIMSAHNSLACDPLNKFGTPEQKEKYLTPIASGKSIGCFALTEPEAGSDAANQKTVAVKEGDYYLVNGSKNFITNAKEASTCVLFAMTDKSKGVKGISTFILPMDLDGVTVGANEDKVGIRGSSTCSIILEDVKIPAENLLAKEGDGFKVAMTTLDGGRIGIAAQALGIGQAAMECAILYAKERVQFGKPIANLQAIQFMLADMATELDAARLLTYRAATLKDKGVKYSKESAMAKLMAAETASKIANKAIQIHGGYGYINEYAPQRHWRDARITEIYEGTSEIQRLVIASTVLREFS